MANSRKLQKAFTKQINRLSTAIKITEGIEVAATITQTVVGGGLTAVALKKLLQSGLKNAAKQIISGVIKDYVEEQVMGAAADYLGLGSSVIAMVAARKKNKRGGGSVKNGGKKSDCNTHNKCFVAGTLVHTVDGTKAIEDIQIGERVVTDADDAADKGEEEGEYSNETHKIVGFEAIKGRDTKVNLQILLSHEDMGDMKVGDIVPLVTSEGDDFADARVTEILPCPLIEKGEGRLVVSRTRHSKAKIYDIKLSNGEVIETTYNHPIWSEDRQVFLTASQLLPGEKLRTLSGTVKVSKVTPTFAEKPVYNFEVQGEHIYRIGDSGVLAHNMSNGIIETCGGTAPKRERVRHYTDRKHLLKPDEHNLNGIKADQAINANRHNGVDAVKVDSLKGNKTPNAGQAYSDGSYVEYDLPSGSKSIPGVPGGVRTPTGGKPLDLKDLNPIYKPKPLWKFW